MLNANYTDTKVNLNVAAATKNINGLLQDYLGTRESSASALTNPSSTQDAFASGEWLKVISFDKGIVTLDLVTDSNDDAFGFIRAGSAMRLMTETSTGIEAEIFKKGIKMANIITDFSGNTTAFLKVEGAIDFNDPLQINPTTQALVKQTTGKLVARALGKQASGTSLMLVRNQKI